jgi:hypothetical protein
MPEMVELLQERKRYSVGAWVFPGNKNHARDAGKGWFKEHGGNRGHSYSGNWRGVEKTVVGKNGGTGQLNYPSDVVLLTTRPQLDSGDNCRIGGGQTWQRNHLLSSKHIWMQSTTK